MLQPPPSSAPPPFAAVPPYALAGPNAQFQQAFASAPVAENKIVQYRAVADRIRVSSTTEEMRKVLK